MKGELMLDFFKKIFSSLSEIYESKLKIEEDQKKLNPDVSITDTDKDEQKPIKIPFFWFKF